MAAVAAWLYFLFFHGLTARDLWNSHEARAAMDAQSLLDGERVLPHLNDGRPELQKPPLYYWLVALTAAPRGTVDAWSVRLPAALAGVLGVAIVVGLGWRSSRRREGLLAALALATALHFTWLARVGRVDMPLTLTTTTALACFFLAELPGARRWGWLLGAYLSLAAAVLLKGPIGVVLVAAALGTFLLVERRWPGSLGLWWGMPLVLALVLPWFLAANAETSGEFGRVFLWEHNVERGLGGGRLRGHPWWFYLRQFCVDFAPWSLLLPVALAWFLRRGRWRYKRADYLVPAYPGAALFLGCVIARRWAERGRRPALVPVALVVMLLSALGWWVRVDLVLPRFEPQREHASFAEVIRRHVPAPEAVILFRTEAHALAHHLGKPVRTCVDWDELDRTLADHPGHVVLPVAVIGEWHDWLRLVSLEEVARNAPDHEKPMVLYRSVGRLPTTRVSRPRQPEAVPCRSSSSCRPSPSSRSAWCCWPAKPRPTWLTSCRAGVRCSTPACSPSRSCWSMTAAATGPPQWPANCPT